MKVTYNWLKDFVEIKLKPEALADKLTMVGLEVTSLEKLEDDYVFEIEVTSNRPDWLSVIGIAREVAAFTGKKLKLDTGYWILDTGKIKNRESRIQYLKINIKESDTCPFYSARIIRNVKVGPSPAWMAKRLQAIGLRPINNAVDITNYILFTTGQPLHAFDLDKINSHRSPRPKRRGRQASHKVEIIVRRARDGEEIMTIDGIKRKLTPEILIIADEKKPIAIAGIMGGKESQVNESTRNILLESAFFSSIATRRASRLLGLSSDSSYRFERSVDKSRIVTASDFASSLILKYAGGQIGRLYTSGSDKVKKKIISFDVKKSNKLIGVDAPLSKIKSILKNMEFKILFGEKDVFKIEVTDFRQDIKSQADMAEEICRIYGYDNIALSLAPISQNEIKEDPILRVKEKIREILTGAGFYEALTYSLQSRQNVAKAGFSLENAPHLENPLSAEQEVLRPSLLIGLLQVLGRNLELGNRPCMLFEIGDCFSKTAEYSMLSLISERRTILELKGILELLLKELGIVHYGFSEIANPIFQEGRSAALIINNKQIGFIGRIKKEILLDFKIDDTDITAFEINLDMLKNYASFSIAYFCAPGYPSVIRDVNVIVDEDTPYQKLLDAIKASSIIYLEDVRFKDVYRCEAIGTGKKSITVSLEFRSPEKTLTDAEVNSSLESIIQGVSRELGAGIRRR
jgi:phenylalanyl-tRNA synthetase beta chain